jgi:hypothetical protein
MCPSVGRPMKANTALLVFALICLAAGAEILVEGRVRSLVLGGERYIVGGTVILVGLYSVFAALSSSVRTRENPTGVKAMKLLNFRILIGLLCCTFAYSLYSAQVAVAALPELAASYVEWLRQQPLTGPQALSIKMAPVLHVLVFVSALGSALLWSPARYAFALTIAALITGEAAWSAPLIVSGHHVMLDNVVLLLSGMVLAVMFSEPLDAEFSRNPFSANQSNSEDS